jgi:L-fuconolactonase
MPHIVVDAHHHFWDPAKGEFPWMAGDAMKPIRRVFGPADLAPLLSRSRIDRTVLVQTQSSLAETADFLATASRTPFVAGVVGWVDLAAPDVDETLARLKDGPHGAHLVGIRHQVHDEPDPEWLLRAEVLRGLAAVQRHGLAYDLLLKPREIPAALAVVGRFPALRFVVDHIAKPMIRRGILAPWAEAMRGFRTHREHVWCKLSGMVTEADWHGWTARDLHPYIAESLDIFGSKRCVYGSDWPVCILAASYGEVKGALEECTSALSQNERAQLFGVNAAELYRLPQTPNWPAGSAP